MRQKHTQNQNNYICAGDKYWKFSNMRPLSGYPKGIKEGFPGIPANIDAVFVWGGNGKIYFFKGEKFWKFDPEGRPFIRQDPHLRNGYHTCFRPF